MSTPELEETKKDILMDSIIIHRELSLLYPDRHKYLQQQIEAHLQLEQYEEAEILLEKLHLLLMQQGLKKDAQEAERIRKYLSQKKHTHHYYSAPFLRLATGSLIEKMFNINQQVHLDEGEYLIHYGDDTKQLYVVVEGELAVWSRDNNGKKFFEHTLRDGEVAGETAFLNDTPRNADIIACKPSVVQAIPYKEVMKLFLEDPMIESSLREESNTRRVQNEMKKNSALQNLPNHLQRIMAEEGEFFYGKQLERLYPSGSPIQTIDLICDGYLRLVGEQGDGSSLILNSLKTGSLIGCSAVTPHMDNNYSADVVCMSDITLVRFPLVMVAKMTELNPRLHQALRNHAEYEQGNLLQTIHTGSQE